MGREPHHGCARTPFGLQQQRSFWPHCYLWLTGMVDVQNIHGNRLRGICPRDRSREPVKKSIPPTPKKRVQKKSKARGKRTAKAANTSAAPSSARNTEAALASLSQLTTGVTHLDVVQSRSKSGTKVSGEVQAYRGEGRIRSGVGRITTAQVPLPRAMQTPLCRPQHSVLVLRT